MLLQLIHEMAARQALQILRSIGYNNIEVVVAKRVRGWDQAAPYEATLVMAASTAVPEALLKQLADAVRLVILIGSSRRQVLTKIARRGDNFRSEQLTKCILVPLIDDNGGRNGGHATNERNRRNQMVWRRS